MITSILTIIELAITAWRSVATGGAADTAKLASTLEQLVAKANQVYVEQTGKPIDPSLLAPIEKVP